MTTEPIERTWEHDGLWAFAQATLQKLHPDFDERTAQAMAKAYWIDPEFVGTPYEHETKLIKAFHLHREINYLAGVVHAAASPDLGLFS